MFEHITQEQLLEDALNEVSNDIDKREGSIIYDALAPHTIQLYQLYLSMESLINEMFGDTASREFLIRLCLDRGITPKPATHAILKGEFNIDIPIGSRFSLDELDYVASKRISQGIYEIQCETAGAIGNTRFGTLIPIEYIDGLQKAELTELLVPGEDEESTESLRKRYLESFDSKAYGGNRKDYKDKVHELQGIGGVKAKRYRDGMHNVLLVVMDSQYRTPSQTLLNDLQTAIDPETNHGEGLGIAPIGHIVKVDGVTEVPVNIKLNITFEDGYGWEDIEISVHEVIDEYFLELKKNWEDSSRLAVRIIQIESRVLEIPGVIDVQNTLLNGKPENLILGEFEIPLRGEVSG